MVIQSESRNGYNSPYQVQASHLAASGGYGTGVLHGGHAPYIQQSGPLGGVHGGGGPGYSSSTSSGHFSQQGGPAGNIQSYDHFESAKYSGGAQPRIHGGAGYGSYGHGGNRVEATTYAYTNSGRPAYTPGQENWNFKSIDD